MFSLYTMFKFLHVGAVIVWVGGVVTMAVLNGRLARIGDREGTRLLAGLGVYFGTRVMLPSAVVALISGIVLMASLGSGFTLWIVWGLAGVFGSILIGATLLRPTGRRLAELAAEAAPDPARVAALRRRLGLFGATNLLLLVSTVAAMIFKPTLG